MACIKLSLARNLHQALHRVLKAAAHCPKGSCPILVTQIFNDRLCLVVRAYCAQLLLQSPRRLEPRRARAEGIAHALKTLGLDMLSSFRKSFRDKDLGPSGS